MSPEDGSDLHVLSPQLPWAEAPQIREHVIQSQWRILLLGNTFWEMSCRGQLLTTSLSHLRPWQSLEARAKVYVEMCGCASLQSIHPIRFLQGLPLGAGTVHGIRCLSYTNSNFTRASPQACENQGVSEIPATKSYSNHGVRAGNSYILWVGVFWCLEHWLVVFHHAIFNWGFL